MKNITPSYLFTGIALTLCLLSSASATLKAQNITKPNVEGPSGTAVNAATGNLFYQRQDLLLPGPGLDLNAFFTYNTSNDTLDVGYGYGWTFSYGMCYYYDSTDIVVVGMDGRRDRYRKVGSDYVPPTGIFDELTFYQADQLSITDKYGMTYFFDDAGHRKLTGIEDLNGNQIQISYTGMVPTTITHNSSRTLSLQWQDNHLAAILDENGATARMIQLNYEDQFLTQVVDPLGYAETYEYGDNRKLFNFTDKRGNPVQVEYTSGKVSLLSSCISEQKFTYLEAKTYAVRMGSSGKQVTIYEFDDQDRLIKMTDPARNCTTYTYDGDNNIVRKVDARGNAMVYTFDNRGNPTSMTDALGGTVLMAYTANSRVASRTDKRGNQTTFTYDAQGNPTAVNQPEGITMSMTYDNFGNLSTLTDPNSRITSFTYNSLGDLTEINYPIGSETLDYDDRGNLTEITDANGYVTTLTYDNYDRVLSVTDPRNKTTVFTYNENGQPETETDPNNNLKTYAYDALGRLAAVTIPAGSITYTYDQVGNLTQITDANGNSAHFRYNAQNLPVERKDALGNIYSFEYDANGNLTQKMDPKGVVTTYTYDALDRLLSRVYPQNTDGYVYDKDGNLIKATNDNMIISCTYDGLGWLISKSLDTWQKLVQYTYDGVGNRTSMTDPDGGLTNYTYDNKNRVATIENPLGEITSFVYDSADRLIEQSNGNGTVTAYTYNDANYVLSVINKTSTDAVLSSFTYTYDDYGNRISMTDHHSDLTTYVYDGSHRLTRVNYPDATFEEFAYDPMGNRISLTTDTGTVNYTYNAADEIQTAGNVNYSFDLNGNLITKTENGNTTTYQYDAHDRLSAIVFPDGTTNGFKYDPLGNRIEYQKSSGERTKYVHDLDNVLQELLGNNNKVAQYTSLQQMDSWLSMERNGNSYTYHKDGLGSIAGLSNSSEVLENEYTYRAYGEIRTQTGAVANPYTYTGRAYDEESDLYFYRTRYYDAGMGRFTVRDRFPGVMAEPLSLNKYNYVHSNPINFVDPEGENGLAIFVLIGVGVVYVFQDDISVTLGEIFDVPDFSEKARKFEETSSKVGFETVSEEERREVGMVLGDDDNFNEQLKDALGNGINNGAKIAKNLRGTIPNGNPLIPRPSFNPWLELGKLLRNLLNPFGNQDEPQDTDKKQEDPEEISITVLHAFDPNDITGETGYGPPQWVSVRDQLGYTIRFENDPDFATAPAQIVRISCPIDPHLNLNAFRLGSFGFGQFIFEVPQNTAFYSNRLDVIDSLGVYVDITAGIDVVNQEAFWIFESIDPSTNQPPEDALTGFLPVNDTTVTIYTDTITQRGEGFVNFMIYPEATSMTGDTIRQQADIVFDDNAPIATNIWENVIDALPPTSQMDELPDNFQADSITLSWSATDDPGGVGDDRYDLYVSKNGAQYTLYASNIDTTIYRFPSTSSGEHAFYVRAIDYVGNKEEQKFIADETVFFGDPCVEDMILPEAVCAGGIEVFLDEFGEGTLSGLELDGGSTDNCSLPLSFSLDQNTFTCADLGNKNLVLTVTDGAGNEAACQATITVITPNEDCFCDDTDLTLNENPIDAGRYQAEQTITSAGMVAADTRVIFLAGQSITLEAPFRVAATADFYAGIATCSFAPAAVVLEAFPEGIDMFENRIRLLIHPNPVHEEAKLKFFLPQSGDIAIYVQDQLGRQIQRIQYQSLDKGWHETVFHSGSLAGGLYYLNLEGAGETISRKMVLMR